jgi:hypothetical protein
MLLSLISALAMTRQEQVVQIVAVPGNPHLTIQNVISRLEPAQKSPKKFHDEPWEFDWLTRGYGNLGEEGVGVLRFQVYSQERKDVRVDKAPLVTRMALQMWERCFHRLKLDNPTAYHGGVVDYYLCFGGDPGGEQAFDRELVPGLSQPVSVNTIYIYQLSTFKDPIEMAREVAHEYGHAVLPAIGGFRQPEAWANGYLGEKLFLTWIRDDMAKGKLAPEDAMGSGLGSLNLWVSKNVDKLVARAGTQFPDTMLINESSGGMEAFEGLAMYVEELCPPSVFLRSLTYTQDAHRTNVDMTPPTDYAKQVLLAASEVENLTLSVPACLRDQKTIWIPLGKGTCSGATVISRKDGWAQVGVLMPTIVIKNPPIH